MNRKKISHKAAQCGTLAVIGAGIVAPLLSLPNPVEAEPVRYAQVRNQNTTLIGVVTQDLLGREFRMRASNGADVRVIFAAGQEPRALSVGDRIRISGRQTSGLFVASSLAILSQGQNNAGTAGQNTTLTGVVTQNLAGREFRMRTSNGVDQRVVFAAGQKPRALSVGDRVRVSGRQTSGLFVASNLAILSNAPASGYAPGTGNQRVNITGTVFSVGSANRLVVHVNNVGDFEVRSRNRLSSAITPGDIVRVVGWRTNNTIQADSVSLVRNGSLNPSSNNARVNLTGTVFFVGSANRLVVHVNNVGDFQVHSRNRLSSAITVGDVVRVVGRRSGNTVQADQVVLVKNSASRVPTSNRTQVSGQNVNFVGTVLTVKRVFGAVGDLQVRGDNGQVYKVRVKNATSFENGDRVRVIGTVNKGSINASSVTRL